VLIDINDSAALMQWTPSRITVPRKT